MTTVALVDAACTLCTDTNLTPAAPASGASLTPLALYPSQTVTYTITSTVTGAPADGFQFSNTASVVSTQMPNPVAAAVSTPYYAPNYTISKSATPATVLDGGTATYTVTLVNTGNVPLTLGTVIDPSCTLGAVSGDVNTNSKLDLGETWVYTCTRVISSNDGVPATPDTVPNTVSSSFTDPGGLAVPKSANANVSVIHPSLSIAASPPAATIYAGGTVTYDYTLTNTGDVTLSNVGVTAANCAAPVYASGDANGDGLMQTSEVWHFSCTTAAVNADQAAQNVSASAQDATLFSSVSSNTVQVAIDVIHPALTIVKTATNSGSGAPGPSDTLTVGVANNVTYHYAVTSTGDSPITAVSVADDTCNPAAYVSGDAGVIGTMEVGETWQFSCVGGQLPKTTTNTATASGTDLILGPVQSPPDTATVTVQAPQLQLAKQADTEYVTAGGAVTFTYSVQNTGGTRIDSWTVADDKCAPLVFAGGDTTANNQIDIGETVTYTCTVNPFNSDALNTFTVTGVTDSLGFAGYTPTPAVAQVFAIDPRISVVKQATTYVGNTNVVRNGPGDVAGALAGDTVVYTYAVTGSAGVNASTVSGLNSLLLNTIGDDKCAPVSPVLNDNGTPADPSDDFNVGDTSSRGQLDPGETWQFTCTSTTVTATPGDVTNTVTVLADSALDIDLNAAAPIASVTSTDTALVSTFDPSVSVSKEISDDGATWLPADTAPGLQIATGATAQFRYVITNTGNTVLSITSVVDDKIAIVTCPGGLPYTLAAGGTLTCTASGPIAAGAYANTGTVTAQPLDPGGAPLGPTVQDTDPANAFGVVSAVFTAKSSSTPSFGAPGQLIDYTITVKNVGNVVLTSVGVVDPKADAGSILFVSADQGSVAGTLKVNETATYSAKHTTTQADVDAGEVLNVAIGSGTPSTGPPVNTYPSNQVRVPALADPKVSLDKKMTSNADQDSSSTVSVGDTLTYTLTATNTGNVALSNVVVTDPLTGQTTTCAVLAPTATCVLTATYVVLQTDVDAGSIVNTGTVTGEKPGGDPFDPIDDVTKSDSETVTLPRNAAVSLIKPSPTNADEDGSGTVSVGDTLTYTLTAKNIGNVTLTNVVVTDPLTGGTTTCPTLAPTPLLPAGMCVLITTYVVVQGDVDAGSILNIGAVTGNPPSPFPPATANAATVTPIPRTPKVSLIKTVTGVTDTNADGVTDAGDTVTYAFTVTNTGNVTLTNVVVTDPLVTVTGSPIPSLAPGVSDAVSFTASYLLTQADVDAGFIENTAIVTGDDPSGNPVTDISDAGDETVATPDGSGAPGTLDPTDDPTVQLLTPAPKVSLIKTVTGVTDTNADGVTDAGDTVTYAFTVTNTGNVTLTNVVVTDPLVTVTGSPIPSLAPGVSDAVSFTASYLLTQADVDAGFIENTAIVTGDDPSGNPVTDISDAGDETVATPDGSGAPGTLDPTDDPTVQLLTPAPKVSLIKTVTGVTDTNADGVTDAGDTVTYTFTVTNTGNVTLTNVVVTDPLVTVTGSPIPSLAPGVSDAVSFTASYLLTQADVDAGFIENTAIVTGDDPSGNPVTDISDAGDETVATPDGSGAPGTLDPTDDPTVQLLTPAPKVSLIKTVTGVTDTNADGVTDAGDTVTYAFTVTNTGNVTLTNVVVTDPLVTVTGSPIPSLAPGVSDAVSFTAAYLLTQADVDAGFIENTAIVTGDDPSGNPVTDISDAGDETVATPDGSGAPGTLDPTDDPTVQLLTPAPKVSLIKTVTGVTDTNADGVTDAGDTVTYAFTVTNTGNVTLTNVVVTDPLVTVTGSPIPSLAPGVSDAVSFTAAYLLTQADVDAGFIENTAIVTGDDPSGNPVTDISDAGDETVATPDGSGAPGTLDPTDDPTVQPLIGVPAVSLVKTMTGNADEDGSGSVSVGDTLTYTLTATNTGTVTLTDVVVTDPMTTGTITCASLVPAATCVLTTTYVVVQGDVDAGSIINTGDVTGEAPGGDPLDPTDNITATDPETVLFTQLAGVSLIKTVTGVTDTNADGVTDAGDTVTYTFTVTNTGNVTLTNVVVTDPLVTVTGSPIPSLAPGVSDAVSFTASYLLTQADVDAGFIENTAIVTGDDPSGNPVTDISDAGDETVATPDGSGAPGTLDPTDDPTVQLLTPAPKVSLIKTVTGVTDTNADGVTDAGDTVTYAFTVTNTGNVTLTNVVVTDPLVTVTGSPIPSLAPGVSDAVSFTASYLLTQADVDAGFIENTAIVTGDDPSGNPVTDISDAGDETVATPDGSGAPGTLDPTDDPTVQLLTPAPKVSLIKTVTGVTDTNADGVTDAGDTVTYAFTVTNTGNVTLTNVVVTDPLVTVTGSPIPSLAPGVSDAVSFTASYLLTQADVDAGFIENTAIVTGDDPSGNPVTDISDAGDETVATPDGSGAPGTLDPTDDPTVQPLIGVPAVSLVKTMTGNADEDGSGSVSVGDTLTYTLTATNTGTVTLTDVVVTDPMTTGTITCASLVPAATCVLTTTYVVVQGDVDAGSIINTGDVTGEAPGGDPLDPTDNITATDPETVLFTQLAGVSLIKTVTGVTDTNADGVTDAGDTVTYAFTVTNTGNVTLTNVVVTDPLVTVTGSPIPSLAPGVSDAVSFTASYLLTQADVDAGFIENTAIVTGDDPSGNPVTDISDAGDETVATPDGSGAPGTLDPTDDPTVQLLTPAPKVSLIKTVTGVTDTNADGVTDAGDTVTYAFTVTNTGNVTLTNVVVTDPLVTVTGSPIPSLAPGVSDAVSFTASYLLTQADVDAGFIENTAIVTGDDPSGNPVTDISDAGDETVATPDGSGAPGTLDPTDDPTVQLLTPAPKVSLIKTVTGVTDTNADGVTDAGDTVTYAFTVTNTGNVTLTNVVVTDPLVTVTGSPIPSLAPGVSDAVSFTAAYLLTQADVDAGFIENTAIVTGDDPSGNPVTDISDAGDETVATPDGSGAPGTLDPTDDPTVQPLIGVPAVSLVKTMTGNADEDGSGSVSVGDTLTYTLTATNTGTVTLTDVVVTDPMTTGTITCASLVPAATCVLTTTYVVVQGDVDAGSIINTGDVTGEAPGGDPLDPTDNITATDPETVLFTQLAGVSLIKTVTGVTDTNADGVTDAGDTVTYAFTVTNTGNVTLTNVVVTDPLVTVTGSPIPSLAPGVSDAVSFTASYLLTQADVDAGFIENTAIVTGDDPSGNPVTDISDAGDETVATPDGSGAPGTLDPTDDPTVQLLTPAPKVSLIKTVTGVTDTNADGVTDAGDTVTYAFTVTNTGNVTLTNVVVTDPLVTVTGSPIPSLAPGVSDAVSFTASYLLTQADVDAGFIENTAIVTGDDPSGNPVTDISDAGDETVATPDGSGAPGTLDPTDDPTVQLLTPAPKVSLIKTVTGVTDTNADGVTDAGDTVTYAFTVTNTGNVTLTNVVVTDPLVTVTGSPIPSLAPGVSDAVSFTASYLLTQADVDAGFIENTAIVTGDDPSGNPVTDISDAGDETVATPDGSGAPGTLDPTDDPTVQPLIGVPAVSLVKTMTGNADEDGSGSVSVGDTLTYTLTATNTGTVTLTDVVVTDPMTTGTITCASLVPAATCVLTTTYVVVQGDVDAGSIINTGDVTGEAPGGDPLDPTDNITATDPETVLFTQLAGVSLIKTVTGVTDTNADGVTDAGDTVTYAFTVTNTGNVTLTNVVVTDPLVTVTGSPIPSLAPGVSDAVSFTASYLLTQADVDAGFIENTAIVTGDDPSGNPVTDISDAGDETVATPDGSGAPGTLDPTDDPTVQLLTPAPKVSLIKTVTGVTDTNADGVTDAGDTVTYAFTVTNTGNVTLTNVVVTDPLVTVTGSPIPSLAPGVSDAVSFTAAYLLTQADVDAGFIENTAIVTGDDPSGNPVTDISDAGDETVATPDGSGAPGTLDPTDDPTVQLLTPAPKVSLIKTVTGVTDTNADGVTDAGDTVTYAFTVTNTGNVTLTNVVVTDPLVTVTGSPIPSLAPGVSDAVSFTASYLLTQADVDAGFIENTAIVTGDDPSGNPVTDISDAGDETVATPDGSGAPGTLDPTDDPTVQLLTPAPKVSLIKTVTGVTDTNADGVTDAGDTVTYAFTVTNTGNVTLTNVVVTDPLVTVTGSPIPSLAPGVSDAVSFTAAYLLTQADVDAGFIENTAIVTGDDPSGNPVTDISDAGDETVATPDGSGAPGTLDPTDDPTVQPLIGVPAVSLVKTMTGNADEDGSGSVSVGDTLTYTLTATNTGTVTLTDVVVTDPMTTGTITCASLVPAATCVLTTTYVVVQGDVDAGSIINTGDVTGEAPGGDPLDPTDNITATDPETVGVPATAVIGDFVWNDLNGNGIQDVGEPGIPGVTVRLVGTDGLGNPVDLVVTTGSGPDAGRYAFVGVPAGQYTLTVTMPAGYAATPVGKGTDPGLDSNGLVTPITVTSGMVDLGVDTGLYVPASVSGSVYFDGDAGGSPNTGEPGIPAVTVTLTGTTGAGDPVSFTTTSGPDGTFTFPDLAPGTYVVTETHPSAWADGADTPPGGATSTNDVIASIVVGSGAPVTGVDFGELGWPVSGAVTIDGTNAPLPGVTMTLKGTDLLGRPVEMTVVTASCNGQAAAGCVPGTYEFLNVPPGTYTITESQPPGLDPGRISPDNVIQLVLSGAPSVGNQFSETASSITGVVYIDTNDNGVFDADESPQADIAVTLTGTDVNGQQVSRTVFTDRNGVYTFPNLVAGDYLITETQPAGLSDGKSTPGNLDGVAGVNTIRVTIGTGVTATGYLFGDVPPRTGVIPSTGGDVQLPLGIGLGVGLAGLALMVIGRRRHQRVPAR